MTSRGKGFTFLCLMLTLGLASSAKSALSAKGSSANSGSMSSGNTHGSEPKGRRKPMGESPVSKYKCSRFSGHLLVSQSPAFLVSTGLIGMIYPTTSPKPVSNKRARRRRSSESFKLALSGSMFSGNFSSNCACASTSS